MKINIKNNIFMEDMYMRDITKTVAKMRFIYHTNMLDICNVANQLGILKDEKAEKKMRNHALQSLDCIYRIGTDLPEFMKRYKR